MRTPLPELGGLTAGSLELEVLDVIVDDQLARDADTSITHVLLGYEPEREPAVRAALDFLEARGLITCAQRFPPLYHVTAAGFLDAQTHASEVREALDDLLEFFKKRLVEARAGFREYTWVDLQRFGEEREHVYRITAMRGLISTFSLWEGGTASLSKTGREFFTARVPDDIAKFRTMRGWSDIYARVRQRLHDQQEAHAALAARDAHAAWTASVDVSPSAPRDEVLDVQPEVAPAVFTIFYAWQSDLPNSTNRGFIEDALRRAIRDVSKDDALELRDLHAEVTKDTDGVPGAPDIPATIFEKISDCDVFIADVTTIGNTGTRRVPNPSVMIELGWAAAALAERDDRGSGWSRVIMVLNTAFGTVEDLPFDIRRRRPLQYHRAEADGGVAKDDLAKKLARALRLIHETCGPRRSRRRSEGQRLLWSAQIESILQLARHAVAGLRQWYPPFYRPTAAGLAKDPTFDDLTRDTAVSDRGFQEAAARMRDACSVYAELWLQALRATRNAWGDNPPRAIGWMREHDGEPARAAVDAAYRNLVNAANELLA